MLVSIPQAVGTIAMLTRSGQPNVTGKEVSIPQAVGTIAIMSSFLASMFSIAACFNTASGRYYCNYSTLPW